MSLLYTIPNIKQAKNGVLSILSP